MRVLVIDQKVVGGFIRQNVGDFRSNFGSTATSKKAENCEKYFEFAQKIAELDVFCSHAVFAFENRYIQPEMTQQNLIEIV